MKNFIDKRAFFLIFLLFSSFIYFTVSLVPVVSGEGENWLGGFSYRKSHVMQSSVGAGTDYQIKIIVCYGSGVDSNDTVYLDGSCKSDFGDIRFTSSDGETELDYWMEEKTDSDTAVFWVKVSDDLSSSNATVYMYYGNTHASTTSDGVSTFYFFDTFDGGSLNTSKWDVVDGSPTVNGSEIYLQQKDGYETIIANEGDDDGLLTTREVRVKWRYAQTEGGHGTPVIRFGISETSATTTNYHFGSWYEYAGGRIYSWLNGVFTYSAVNDPDLGSYYSVTRILSDGVQFKSWGSQTCDWTNTGTPDLYSGFTYLNVGWDTGSYVDWIFTRKYVESEPLHGEWGIEIGKSCTVVSFSILDMDDTDNLYAQKKYYTAQYVVATGSEDIEIDYAEFSITRSSDDYATFRFDEQTKTFSMVSGASYWDLDSDNCSFEVSGKTIMLHFMISPKFSALEESNLDIYAFVVDNQGESDSKVIQTDYFDVVTRLVVDGFGCDDDRGDVGQMLEFSGGVFYLDDPLSDNVSANYPSDSLLDAVHVCDSKGVEQGSDRTLVNGTFSVKFFAKSSVALEAYHPSIELKDFGTFDLEETPTVTFITDRIKILTLGAKDSRINVNDFAEIYVTAELEYDGQSLDADDILTMGSVDFVWNQTCFVGTETKSSVQQKIYDELEAEETKYGITVLDMGSNFVSVVWDRLNVDFTVNNNLVPLTDSAQFTVNIVREYDNSPLESYVYTIERDGLDISNTYATSRFTDVSDSQETRIYDFASVFDNTYGLTAFTDPDDISVAWYPGLSTTHLIIIGAVATVAMIGLLYLWKRKKS